MPVNIVSGKKDRVVIFDVAVAFEVAVVFEVGVAFDVPRMKTLPNPARVSREL
jgi:hypothetical protein